MKADTHFQNVLKTVFLALVWVCLGLFLEITGPTLIDLKIRTNADYESVAVAVSGRSVGYFIGSAIGGPLVDKLERHCYLMIGLCLNGGAIATVIAPWSTVVGVLWFLIVLQGTFEGIINIAGQRLILIIWQEKAASPLHILHGGFPIGSFIIPLIANPFLAVPKQYHGVDNATLATNSSLDMSHMNKSLLEVPGETIFETSDDRNKTNYPGNHASGRIEFLRESRIEYPYLIAAVITSALSVVFFVYHYREIRKTKNSDYQKSLKLRQQQKMSFKQMFNPATCANGRLCYGLQIFTGLVIYFFNLLGAERIGGKFIRAFSIEQLDFSVSDGSYLNMAFWISHAVGRVSGFIAARWIPIRILILIETGGFLLTIIFMNVFAYRNTLALWILTQPFGFFLGPIFPSGIGWGDYHIQLTGMGITIILLGASCGGVAYLKLTGFLFENYGPRSYLYHLLGVGIAAFSLAIILDLIGSQHGHRFAAKNMEINTEDIQEDEIHADKILLGDRVSEVSENR